MAKAIDIKAAIAEAVKAGLEAGRLQAASRPKDAFKATERRMGAVPVLRRKIQRDKEKLAELRCAGLHGRSRSIARFQKNGLRVTPEEMLEAVANDLEATIAADAYEVEEVTGAMEAFSGDPYYAAVTGKYIDRLDDGDIAAGLNCSGVQVWRQRNRIVSGISVMLYGACAV